MLVLYEQCLTEKVLIVRNRMKKSKFDLLEEENDRLRKEIAEKHQESIEIYIGFNRLQNEIKETLDNNIN